MDRIVVRGLKKSFDRGGGRKLPVLDGLSFTVEEGGFTSILGPSGCGKTTLLRVIAGIEAPDGGEARIEGRGGGSTLSLVYQQNDLLPWLTVRDNMRLAVRGKDRDRESSAAIIDDCLDKVGLRDFDSFYPSELSGGMQKRVSLARALAADPEVVLCDEPLAHLDFQSRIALQKLMTELFVQQKKTVLYVTHNLYEAVLLSRKTILLSALPARIKADVDIPFDYPRDVDEVKFSKQYHDLVAAMEGILREEVVKTDEMEKRKLLGGL